MPTPAGEGAMRPGTLIGGRGHVLRTRSMLTAAGNAIWRGRELLSGSREHGTPDFRVRPVALRQKGLLSNRPPACIILAPFGRRGPNAQRRIGNLR